MLTMEFLLIVDLKVDDGGDFDDGRFPTRHCSLW